MRFRQRSVFYVTLAKNEHRLHSLLFLVYFRLAELVQRIFTCGDTQLANIPVLLELRITLNSSIHGSPFYVVMYSSYNLLKQFGFGPHCT